MQLKRRGTYTRYVPAFNGNRTHAQPFLAEIRGDTYGEQRALARKAVARNGAVLDDELDGEFFSAHVRRIEGLDVEGTSVTTGADLWALRDDLGPGLFVELFAAIRDASTLAEGLEKNSPSPSGSPSSIRVTAGTVPTADGAVLTA